MCVLSFVVFPFFFKKKGSALEIAETNNKQRMQLLDIRDPEATGVLEEDYFPLNLTFGRYHFRCSELYAISIPRLGSEGLHKEAGG